MAPHFKAVAKKRWWRPSFTLIELMVVITIIGIMAGMILYTLAGAQRDAYVARTQGTIKKLNDILLPLWEEYRYRSVKVNIPQSFLVPYRKSGTGTAEIILAPREGARARMMALRDLMRMEMPDRYTDILFPPVKLRIGAYTADNYTGSPVTGNDMLIESVAGTGTIDREVPGRLQAFRRKMVTEPSSAGYPLTVNPYPAAAPVAAVGALKPTVTNQSAELLYEIIASSSFQGTSALEFFRPSEVGDTDNDGYKEFLDAWGRPIYFLRWPAGYVSDLNDQLTPDPLDPLKTDWRWNGTGQKPWMLVPLIISAGADGEFDIAFDFNADGNGKFTPCVDPSAPYGAVQYAETFYGGNTDPGGVNIQKSMGKYYFPDPYAEYAVPNVATPQKVGAIFDQSGDSIDNSIDNITNYELVLQ